MATNYVDALIDVLVPLDIAIPEAIRADQKLTVALLGKVKEAVDGLIDTIAATPTLAELTADATATATDIVTGKTAYVNGDKVVGSNVNTHYYSAVQIDETGAVSAQAVTELLKLSANTCIVTSRDQTGYRFMPRATNVDSSEIYLAGAAVSEAGVGTFYIMTISIVDGVGTITSIKDTSDTEDISNWPLVGSVVMYLKSE